MEDIEIPVLCYWNGCIKYGPDGIYYEGSAPKLIRVKRNTDLIRLLDLIYVITGSKLDIIGRYPSVVRQSYVRYVRLPVVNEKKLKVMLEVPLVHPSISNVELYLEVKETSSSWENPGNSLKRQKTHQPSCQVKASGNVDASAINPPDGVLEVKGVSTRNVTGLEVLANACLNKDVDSGVLKPWRSSSLWFDDHELHVGLCFKDIDGLKKAVGWCSIRGRHYCTVQETEKGVYAFECVRWKCKWSLWASRVQEDGLVEIVKYTGPHTCFQEDSKLEFAADEIERAVRVEPTLSAAELKKWWNEKTGHEIRIPEVENVKRKAIEKIFGDWDQSFRVMPKLMTAFQSSNGLLVDWRYDLYPNPDFASFRGVFWAFSQSIEGFPHCRPLIIVDTKDLNGKYPMKLMIASGIDAANKCFPLAFAVTKEVISDTWRWFLTGIREKVTQRKGLCLISSPHPDILAVINEPGSLWQEPWAYHRFCLNHLSTQFSDVFKNSRLKIRMELAGVAKKQDEFDSLMEIIETENPDARRWLDQMPPHQWALAHDSSRRYGIMSIKTSSLSTFSGSFDFNGLPMTGAVLLLFDELRSSFDKSFSSSRGSLNCGHVYTEPVTDKLKKFMKDSATYVITPLERDAFQVSEPLDKKEWIVQLSDSTCTCGEFQSCKFPCLHALALCNKLKINPLQYVDECYTLERYQKMYAAKFNPVPQVSAWLEAPGVPTLFPPVNAPPPPQSSPLPPPPPPSSPLSKVTGKSQRKTTGKKKS